MKNTIQFSDIFVNIFGTHLDPSELTDSVDLCLASFPPGAGKSGITSQLLTTPFVWRLPPTPRSLFVAGYVLIYIFKQVFFSDFYGM